ncbi:MAG: LysR substrate-binding domain-containing protein, partial [Hydrogenophaga sp.]|nr:LysR substrate-binding domain-containing protein [Hydrogenophaga sp.]
CLRMKPEGLSKRPWTLFRSDCPEDTVELDVQPVLWANHTDTLLGATLGGAGISATPVEIAAPHLASGALVRVLSPWIAGRFTLYAALPSRKFMPQRSRVFLDYLGVETQRSVLTALAACEAC